MARLALSKLLHPFTADDILESRQIVSSLKLPPTTAQFVLALPDPRSRGNVVFVLAVERLSERSIEDIDTLVRAVNPRLVVAFVEEQDVRAVLEESDLLEAPESLVVPTAAVDIIKACFAQKTNSTTYENRAGLRVLISVFGTTFYGNAFAARKAAAGAQAAFEFVKYPFVGLSAFSEEGEELTEGAGEVGAASKVSTADRFLTCFSGLLGGNDVDYLAGLSRRVAFISRSNYRQDFDVLAPAIASNLFSKVAISSTLKLDAEAPPLVIEELSTDSGANFPTFAAPFHPYFVDLHRLFKATEGVNQALPFLTKLLNSVESGNDVDDNDLSRARLFRVAVESVRLCWNSATLNERKPANQLPEFSQLSVEEKCQALLARALQLQAQKFGTVVAVVEASSVSGIRRHWNTPIPSEFAAYADYCVVALDSDEAKMINGNVIENLEAKAAVVVSAGAVAAGLFSIPQWASFPTFVKIFSIKVPTALKLVWLQMKRQAIVTWASAASPVSNMVLPALKAVGSGQAAFAQSSAAKAVLVKSVTSAEKARTAAQTIVAAAERSSFRALRTAFYSLMRNRNTKYVGPRPWLVLGVTLAATAGIFQYSNEVEGAIGILPSIPSVVRLGRGLENLDRTSKAVGEREGARWWDLVYDTLYRHPLTQA